MTHDSCIIEDFILPSLSSKRFDFLMEWVNENKGIFRVFWSHKSGRTWSEKDNLVFTTWDQVKKRDNQKEEDYFTNSKGRFRSALNRLKHKVTYLKSMSIKGYRYYQLKLSSSVKNGHLAKKNLEPILCFPYYSFESCISENQNCKTEIENHSCPSSPALSSDSEDQNCRIETEGFSDSDMESVLDSLKVEQDAHGCQSYDSYVPDMDQFCLDAVYDIVSIDDIQKCTDDNMLVDLEEANMLSVVFEADNCFDSENIELQTISPDDLKELCSYINL